MGHGGDILSYALNQRVFACGHPAVTIAGAATGGSVSVSVSGLKKASDTILVTLDSNNESDAAVTLPPFVNQVLDNTAFTADLEGVANNGVTDITVFLNWVVLR